MLVDLHLHTIATPHHATWEPAALVRTAREQGVSIIAVTDHNTTDQVQAALDAAAAAEVKVIPGLELDSAMGDRLWHVLIYGIDPHAPAITKLGCSVAERNWWDAQAMAKRLRAEGHVLRSFDAIPQAFPRRPTVADLGLSLVQDGIVAPQAGVEDEAAGAGWIMTNLRELYLPVTVGEAIAVTHAHGGVAVLAHPGRSKGRYAVPATADDVRAMVELGLDGIEALYAGHTAEQQHFYSNLAAEYGLLVSAGSDSHHPAQGLRPRAAADCAALLARLGVWEGETHEAFTHPY